MRTTDSFLVALIGAGIGPSLTPPMHEREADELGLRYLYRRLDLDALGRTAGDTGELLAAAQLAGYDGLNITHPCKQAVAAHLDDLAPDAADLGAVNTVVHERGPGGAVRAVGHNTDRSGFSRALGHGLPGAELAHVLQVGAGGAGSAVAYALLELGAQRLSLLDADPSRASALATALADRFGPDRVTAAAADGITLAAELNKADGLVHATPTGMAAHPGCAVPAELLDPRTWVADVVYRPLETELVTAARARGCRVLHGGWMAVFQAVDAFRLFTGVEPDAERMVRHFAELEGVVLDADS
ncbi:shikimate dehydrogenase [Bounagaea algeriensis]